MSEKLTGYLLLIGGVGIILYSLWNVERVFTGKASAPSVFQFPAVTIDASQAIANSLPSGMRNQITLPESKVELLPSAMINEIANVTGHVVLMSFMGGVGFKLASLGIQLLRPIEVRVSAKKQ